MKPIPGWGPKKTVLIVLCFLCFYGLNSYSQSIGREELDQIKCAEDFYNSSLYKKLEINSWRVTFDDKRTFSKSIIFYNDSTNKFVELVFKKPIKNNNLELSLRNSDIRNEKLIYRRRVRNVIVNLNWVQP